MSSKTAEKITADLTVAMKARDKLRTEVLRGLKSELKYWEIEAGHVPEEGDCQKVLRTAQKKRRDAIALYQQGGRDELAKKEEAELAIVSEYLPAEMPEDELKSAIASVITEAQATSIRDLGRVMKLAMQKLAGRTEGNRVRQVASGLLSEMSNESAGE